jgi:hypothetical protein
MSLRSSRGSAVQQTLLCPWTAADPAGWQHPTLIRLQRSLVFGLPVGRQLAKMMVGG